MYKRQLYNYVINIDIKQCWRNVTALAFSLINVNLLCVKNIMKEINIFSNIRTSISISIIKRQAIKY